MDKKTKNLLMVGGIGLAGVIGYSVLSQPKEQGFAFTGGSGGGGAGIPKTKVIDSGGGSVINYNFPEISQPDFDFGLSQGLIDFQQRAAPRAAPKKSTTLSKTDLTKIAGMGREYWREQGIKKGEPIPISDVYAPREIVIGGPEWQATRARMEAKTKKEGRINYYQQALDKPAWSRGIYRFGSFLRNTFF